MSQIAVRPGDPGRREVPGACRTHRSLYDLLLCL